MNKVQYMMNQLMKMSLEDLWVWGINVLNVVAMVPQAVTLYETKNSEGLSLTMFACFFVIQGTYARVGYKAGVPAQMWGMGASMLVTSTNIFLGILYRS